MPGHRTYRAETPMGTLECFKFVVYAIDPDGTLRALEPSYIEWRLNGSEIAVQQARALLGEDTE